MDNLSVKVSKELNGQREGGCGLKSQSSCGCSTLRRAGLGIALPGAGSVLAFAFLPKCPLCWMALMATCLTGFHRGVLLAVAAICVTLIVFCMRTLGVRRTAQPTNSSRSSNFS
jgi:hypothetical protein